MQSIRILDRQLEYSGELEMVILSEKSYVDGYMREWMLIVEWIEVLTGLLVEYRGTGKEKDDQLMERMW